MESPFIHIVSLKNITQSIDNHINCKKKTYFLSTKDTLEDTQGAADLKVIRVPVTFKYTSQLSTPTQKKYNSIKH